MHYRKRLRQGHDTATEYYTNELHDALLSKQGPNFWKCWKSKFDLGNKCTEIDGCADVHVIAEKFAAYFEKCYSCNNVKQKRTPESEYSRLHANYAGFPTANEPVFDTELVSKFICNLKLGKAADIDGLTGNISTVTLYFKSSSHDYLN